MARNLYCSDLLYRHYKTRDFYRFVGLSQVNDDIFGLDYDGIELVAYQKFGDENNPIYLQSHAKWQGFTASGEPRWEPHTMEEALEIALKEHDINYERSIRSAKV